MWGSCWYHLSTFGKPCSDPSWLCPLPQSKEILDIRLWIPWTTSESLAQMPQAQFQGMPTLLSPFPSSQGQTGATSVCTHQPESGQGEPRRGAQSFGYVDCGIHSHAWEALFSQPGMRREGGSFCQQPPCLHILVQNTKESNNYTFILGLRVVRKIVIKLGKKIYFMYNFCIVGYIEYRPPFVLLPFHKC